MPPLLLFKEVTARAIEPNMLIMNIQPHEGISLHFTAKSPGSTDRVQTVVMDFNYETTFKTPAPEAYERLLLDAMLGDSTLFTRNDEVEAAWKLITPVIERWEAGKGSFIELYRSGSWGPKEADDFIAADGRKWHVPA
jgi:glucose-6-phosphate 1-dehydrogenase